MRYIAIVLVLLLLASCAPQVNETQPVDSGDDELKQELEDVKAELDELKSKVDAPPVKTPVPEKITPEPAEDPMSREMRVLLEKIQNAKEENYHYYYVSPKRGTEADQIFVKGDLVKIELFDANAKESEDFYNRIYLDRGNKEAAGYCIGRYVYCPNGKGPFPVEYADHTVITAQEWADKITSGEIIAYDSERKRPITVIMTEIDGVPAEVSLDSFYSLPLIIKMNPKSNIERVYRFQDLFVGDLTDADVTPPKV